MPRYRALTDLCLWDGRIIQAGSEFDAPSSYPPPCHAVQPLDAEGMQLYYDQGPRVSDVEIWRQCFTNTSRWSNQFVPAPTTYWIKSGDGYVLHGGGEGLGPKPPSP